MWPPPRRAWSSIISPPDSTGHQQGASIETQLTAVVSAFALIAIGYGTVRLKILGPVIFPALNSFVYCLAMSALVPASHSVLVNSVFIMTGAVLILEFTRARETGSTLFNIAKVLCTNSLLLAVVTGLALSLSIAALPISIERLLNLLGQVATPSALVAIGLFLAGWPVVGLLASAAISSLAKLALFPFVV